LLHRLSQITCAVDKARRDVLILERPIYTRDVHSFANRYTNSSALKSATHRLTVSWTARLSWFSVEDRLSFVRCHYCLHPLHSDILSNLSFSCIVYVVVYFLCSCL